MGIREWINKQPAIAGSVAGVVVIGVLIYMTAFGGGKKVGGGDTYWYDTKTEEIYTAKGMQDPPWTSPDGNPAYRAHLFTCGQCTESERFVGYYERFNSDSGGSGAEALNPIEISPDGENWVTQGTAASEQLVEGLSERCEGNAQARPCDP